MHKGENVMKINPSVFKKNYRISFVLAIVAALLVFTGVFAASEPISLNFATWVGNIFISSAVQDGWVLESGENTNIGEGLDKNSTTLIVGDDAKNRQYISILSFNTSTLPDQIVITAAQIKLKKQGFVGNPFTALGDLVLDIKDSAFSQNAALQLEDFSALANPCEAGRLTPGDVHIYIADLSPLCFKFISRIGLTQFRLHFVLDDNNNSNSDYLRFFSGGTASEIAPQLIVTYCAGPESPVLTFPSDDAVVFAGPINFTWNTPSSATEYQIEFMDSAGTPIHTSPWIGATNYYASLSAGTYKWHVRARNADGDCLWSDSWDLTVSDPPTPIFPPNGAVVFAGITNFTWNAVPENILASGATEYYLEYSGTSSGNCDWSNATSCTVNLVAGSYSWRVKTRNAISESAWSETWTLTVSDPPTLVSPPNGAVVFVGITNLIWNPVPENIPASGATEYQFELMDLAGNPILNSGWIIGATSYSPNLVAGSYRWYVKAKNAISESAWDNTWDLTVSDPPTHVSPPNGSVVFAGITNFTWNTVLENIPVSGATQYCFAYGSGDCDILSPESSGWISATNYSISMAVGTYNWHVKAKNAISTSGWSASWSLIVSDPPTLTDPPDNATVFAGPVNFTWNVINGATEYYFEYMDSSNTPLGNSGWISSTNYLVLFNTPLGNCPWSQTTCFEDVNTGPYYWHVKARNSNINSESLWSATRKFSIAIDIRWTNENFVCPYHYYFGSLDANHSKTTARFITALAHNITLSVTTAGDLSVYLSLYYPNGSIVGKKQGPGNSLSINEQIPINKYYWVVIERAAGSGNYNLRLTYDPVEQPCP
jgi:hypothetical protein